MLRSIIVASLHLIILLQMGLSFFHSLSSMPFLLYTSKILAQHGTEPLYTLARIRNSQHLRLLYIDTLRRVDIVFSINYIIIKS